MSEGWSICKEAGKKYAARHWERSRCKKCQEHERLCPVCAGVI